MGYESFIDVAAAKDLAIPITNTPGTLSNSVAEFTIGLTLSATRKLYFYASAFATGHSGKEEKQHDLANLHVGIIGLGGVGTRVAEILRNGFAAKVTYYSQTRKPSEESRLGISYAHLDSLFADVDLLIVMTPGNDETKGLINHALLSLAKPGLILINTARPEIVEPSALFEGLQNEKIAYAAYDGFYENIPNLELRLKTLIPKKLHDHGAHCVTYA